MEIARRDCLQIFAGSLRIEALPLQSVSRQFPILGTCHQQMVKCPACGNRIHRTSRSRAACCSGVPASRARKCCVYIELDVVLQVIHVGHQR